MPTMSLTEDPYATLRPLAPTRAFRMAHRTFHSDRVFDAMTFMGNHRPFNPKARTTLTALYTLFSRDNLATLGLARRMPVGHTLSPCRDYGCWITRVKAQTYLATTAQGVRTTHVVAKQSNDAPLDPLFRWTPEPFSPVPASIAPPQTAHWSQP